MCSFSGFCNLYKDITNENKIIEKMNLTLKKKNTDEEGYFKDEHIHFAYRNLIEKDIENINQVMDSFKYKNTLYTIIYNGQIYNREEIKKELIEKGFEFKRIFRYRTNIKSICLFWNKNI